MKKIMLVCGVASLTAVATPAARAYVVPMMGGGQIMGSMIMPEISFNGSNILVLAGTDSTTPFTAPTPAPVLNPLTSPAAFDPAQSYAVLSGQAYNFQYGWDSGQLDLTTHPLPAGSAIWIEQISATPGLNVYDRGNSYAPIFGTAGSSSKWKWNGGMAHNTYAATPGLGSWTATYDVYIGDAVTGTVIAGYGSATTTFNWTSTPEPSSLALLGLGALMLWRRSRRPSRVQT